MIVVTNNNNNNLIYKAPKALASEAGGRSVVGVNKPVPSTRTHSCVT